MYTMTLDKLDVEHLIKHYIFYVSIFNCVDFDLEDTTLNLKIKEIQDYINERISDVNV